MMPIHFNLRGACALLLLTACLDAQAQSWGASSTREREAVHADRDAMMANIVGLDDKSNWKTHFKDCDLVIEAVLEDLGLKHKVIEQFEEVRTHRNATLVGRSVGRSVTFRYSAQLTSSSSTSRSTPSS